MAPLTIRCELFRFLREERAGITVEWVFMFPMLIWTYAACFAFFDAFRAKITALNAGATISDMISRNEGQTLDQDYIDGLHSIFEFLMNSPDPNWIRVTSFVRNDNNGTYELHWSSVAQTPGMSPSMAIMTQQELNNISPDIPALADGDCAFLVETNVTHTPVFSNLPVFANLVQTLSLGNFMVVSPRFQPWIPYRGAAECLPSS